MSKQVFQAIDQQDWRSLSQLMEDPEAVRSLYNLPACPSVALGRSVVSPLEWAILRREPKAVEVLFKAAPWKDHGRDPDAAFKLLLEVFEDDFQEVHWPDRDRHPTLREAQSPPRGRTPAEVLKDVGQLIVLFDRAGVDWGRLVQGRPALAYLDIQASSPAGAAVRSIFERVTAQQAVPARGRRAGVVR